MGTVESSIDCAHPYPLNEENDMRPMTRHPVNKNQSASSFRKQTRKTKAANLNGLARGGWRL